MTLNYSPIGFKSPHTSTASVSTLPLAVFNSSLEGVTQDQRKATVEEHVLQDP